MNELPINGQLAMRILNFVASYIPKHVWEECLDLIKKETKTPVTIKDNSKHNYAHTTIRWKDDGGRQEAIFKLNTEVDAKDDQIFFYCESEEDYQRIASCYDNGEDFEVIGCTLYTETL